MSDPLLFVSTYLLFKYFYTLFGKSVCTFSIFSLAIVTFLQLFCLLVSWISTSIITIMTFFTKQWYCNPYTSQCSLLYFLTELKKLKEISDTLDKYIAKNKKTNIDLNHFILILRWKLLLEQKVYYFIHTTQYAA